MKQYYMETNSIRNLSKYLKNKWVRENCFTSLHTIIELLTDLDETSFGRKKAAVTRVLDSRIEIDWRQPQLIQLDSYGMTACFLIEKDKVENIMKCLIESESVEAFDRKMKAPEYFDIYERLKRYDKGYNTYFDAEMKSKTQEFHAEFDYKKGKEIFIAFAKKIDKESPEFEPSFRKLFIIATALKLAEDLSNSELNTENCQLMKYSEGITEISMYSFMHHVFILLRK